MVHKKNYTLSVIIKTYNEEDNISRCIESVFDATKSLSTEIIVADCGSSDNTVEIACNYHVTVVVLSGEEERSCGIAPQLGYQYSSGKYILILDADMVLHENFILKAIEFLDKNPDSAAVGGKLFEVTGKGYEYNKGYNSFLKEKEEEVSWINGCGLYRNSAVNEIGYLTNRNLHAYEEKELGLRLKNSGWNLYLLPCVAVDHYGYCIETYKLIFKRWLSGYGDGCGESLRVCLGKPYFIEMAKIHKTIILCFLFQCIFLFALLLLPIFPYIIIVLIVIFLLFFSLQSIRKKSMINAFYGILYTNIFSIGMIRGFFRKTKNPEIFIKSNVFNG